MSRRSIRRLAAPLALAAVLAACAAPAQPGVKVRSVNTELGLGIVNTPPPAPEQPELPDLDDDFDFDFDPPKPPPPPPPVDICPEAGLLDFPEKEATPSLSAVPEVGRYRWKYDLTVLDADRAAGFMPAGLAHLAPKGGRHYGSRTIRAITPEAQEQAVPELYRGSFSYTQEDAPGVGPVPEAYQRGDRVRVQGSSYLDSDRSDEDAGEGVSLVFSAWAEKHPTDPNGMPSSWLVVYGPPLNIINFPVSPGQQITSASSSQSVDPIVIGDPTQAKAGPRFGFVLQGLVTERMQVDACGDVVAAWKVDGSLTIQRDETQWALDYDYGVATQLGGIVVYERFAYPAEDPAIVIEASIGQIEPDPIDE